MGQRSCGARLGLRTVSLLLAAMAALCAGWIVLFYWLELDRGASPREIWLAQRLTEREEQMLQLLGAQELETPALRGSSTSATADEFNETKLHADLTLRNDRLVRALLHRRNTRYWLETQPEWPAAPIPPTDRYVTFAPWNGGFNNIRMSLEMAAAFAIATQRTLVLPPTYRMYLRGKSSMESYFDLDDMRRGFPVLTYDEWFERIDFGRYQKERPDDRAIHGSTGRYFAGLEQMPGVYDTAQHWRKDAIGGQMVYCLPNCPKPAENSAESRWFAEFARRLTPIDAEEPSLRDAAVVHFPKNLLGHFYTMVWFRDPQLGRRVKRLVRDHIHFREDIVEMAERVVSRLGDFKFSCLHVRRNDFQFKDAWTPAETIVAHTSRLWKPDETIYISTDELSDETERKRSWSDPKAMVTVAKHSWFEPMKEAWGPRNVVFLSDFFEELLGPGTPDIYLGCIETIVCARARVFVGTRKSTFSGYIHRLRGYMHDVGQKLILDAQTPYPDGYYEYFKGPEWAHLKGAYGGGHPYWGREYKDAWEGVYDPLG